MEKIDDLSFSNIVNIIQGDEKKGADLINAFALEQEDLKPKIEEAERNLKSLEGRVSGLKSASRKVAKHLKKELPLAVNVNVNDYIVIVSDMNLTIERNVI